MAPIAFVQEGDSITIDAHKLLLQLNIDDAELQRRRAAWQQPLAFTPRGVLAKYSALALPTRAQYGLSARCRVR